MEPPLDSQFLSMVIHDLLTPLNVIGLSLRMIDQVVSREDATVREDLDVIAENVAQMERMLRQLSHYAHLNGSGNGRHLNPGLFDPRRLLGDLVEERAQARPSGLSVPGQRRPPIHLEIREDSPAEVDLDPDRARLALQLALDNATTAASEKGSIRVSSGGRPGRWVIRLGVDVPPPVSVQAEELRPESFKRLLGAPAERRGLDLAIAARITELFGGSARLEVEEGRGTTIVLDWPTHATPP